MDTEKLLLAILMLIAGLPLLVKGADWFVDGAAGIAEKCRISPLVIGLTVVAFGTSAPELAVSITAAVQGSEATGIAIGNVVGSNICNILLILGLSAVIRALPVKKVSLWLDLPVLLIASGLLIGLGAWGNALEWYDGLILLVVFACYMAVLFWNARKEQKQNKLLDVQPEAEETQKEPKTKVSKWFAAMEQKTWFLIVLTVIGLGMVVGGGILLVEGAKEIANQCNVPSDIIGLTVVAIGTSLPELVTSVVAASKGKTDIAVGNIIGSNIFNIFLVAGVSSLFHDLEFVYPNNLIDGLVALGAAVMLYVFVLLGRKKLGRAAGAVMLLSFIGYYVYLFLVRI